MISWWRRGLMLPLLWILAQYEGERGAPLKTVSRRVVLWIMLVISLVGFAFYMAIMMVWILWAEKTR